MRKEEGKNKSRRENARNIKRRERRAEHSGKVTNDFKG